MRSLRLAAPALVMASCLMLLTPFLPTASAKKPMLVFGTVTLINPKSFDVATPAGTNPVVRFTKKTVFVAKSASANVAGFQVGDAVLAQGPARRPFVARTVYYDLSAFVIPGTMKAYPVAQYVTDTPGLNLTIKFRSGTTQTFDVNDNTAYVEDGSSTTTPVYALGDRVQVRAQDQTDGTWLARAVNITTHHAH